MMKQDKRAAPRVRLPVWLKIAAAMSLLALLVALAIVLTLTPRYRQSLSRSGLEYGASVSSDLAQTMNARVESARAGLSDVGRTLSDERAGADERIQRALLLVEGNLSLDHAAIYDAQGALIDTLREERADAPAAPDRLPKPLLDRLEALKFKGLSVDRVKPSGRAPMAVAIVAKDKVTGYVYSEVSLLSMTSRAQELVAGRFEGRADALMVVDWDGQILVHADAARVGQSQAHIPQIKGKTYEMVAAGVAEIGEYQAPDGQDYLIAYQPLAEAPWAVIAQIPHAIAFAPLEQMRRGILQVLLGALLCAIALSLVLAWALTRPIERLVEVARALGQRRFEQCEPIETGDELGVLSFAMTQAAQDLVRSEAELIRQERVRQDLGRFLPQELVDRVVAQEQALSLGGERVEVTVLFADVVGFTSICEGLRPEDTVAILNELFTIMTEIVFRHQGTVDKFMGDCMMAFWGPPQSATGHATRALEAAEEILSWLEIGNAGWQERFGVSLELAIGVNTGEAILGNVGSESRMEYTVIGDAVNIAARLEAIARPQQILVTEATVNAADDIFDVVDVGQKQLAGHEQPVLIYEVRL